MSELKISVLSTGKSSIDIVAINIYKAFVKRGIVSVRNILLPDSIEFWVGASATWCPTKDSKVRVGWSFSESPRMPVKNSYKYMERANLVDILFVCSDASARMFREAAFDKPIIVIPLGVDIDNYPFIERDYKQVPFTFLHFTSQFMRKGTDLVLKAFRIVREQNPNIQLLVHCYKGVMTNNAINDIETTCKEYPGVIFERETNISQLHHSVLDVYRDCHCLIAPSREEGWGMCITEAMATGMPVITTRSSAMREYFSDRFGWWVNLSNIYNPASIVYSTGVGYIGEPDITTLIDSMVIAINNRDICAIKGTAGSKYIKECLTWDHSVVKMLPLLQVLNTKSTAEVIDYIQEHPIDFRFKTWEVSI